MLTTDPLPEDDDDNEENGAIMMDPMGPKTPIRSKGKGRKRDRYQDSEQLIPSPPPPPPNKTGLAGIPGMLEGMSGTGSARKLMEGAAHKLRRRQKTAVTLRVVRRWLMKIIYAQAAGNLLRALPIFILEKYMIMLLIFFQLIFLACGYFGAKGMRPYLLLLYSIGIFATTIPDVTVAITYVRTSLNLPAAEAGLAFAVYVLLVSALAVLNVVGGLLLGIRMCVSVMVLKNPKEYALVLQAASWVGSFEGKDDDEEEHAKIKKMRRRTVLFQPHAEIEEVPATPPPAPPPKFATNEVITSKYNAVTFFPRLVYLQFSRLANLYTLCIVTLCMFSFSPVGPLSSLTPLLVVFGVAGLKELIEDIKRHKQDKLINTRGTLVFKHEQGDFVPTTWAEVRVGDVLMMNNNEMIPCDLILLSSSRQDGRCYLETANLDGETNLKHRVQLPQLGCLKTPKDLAPLRLSLECEGPNSSIYTFEGALTARFPEGMGDEELQNTASSSSQPGSHVFSVGGDMLLQRGTILRNTQWLYGLAVYTGPETKVEQNGVPAPMKRSYLERSVNVKLIFLLLLQTIVCIICAIGHNKWKINMPRPEDTYPWYVFPSPDEHDYIYVSYLILYNTMIPLSMYVSMEMVRVTNSTQITGAEGIPEAAVRSTSIMEELGQVQYLFADKTGTLTCNEMVVRRLSIVGRGVEFVKSPDDEGSIQNTEPPQEHPNHALLTCHRNTSMTVRDECLLLMVLCNTVQVETDSDGVIKYSTGSPDEEALVRCAARSGVELIARENNTLTINWHGTQKVFTILQILEFNSYRRRMSVIARREEDGAILLLCKGADSVIFARLRPAALGTDETTQHINEFAGVGLRTLCFAATTLDPEEYTKWSVVYKEATLSVEHRAQKVDEAAEQIETHLTLLGAVGIEDRLQPGVSDCVSSLQEAGIHVWVLTGDKTETAIAVATQASVLSSEMQIEILEEGNEKELIRRLASLTEQLSLLPPLPPLVAMVVGFLGLDPLSLPPILRPPPSPLALALVLTDVSLPIALSREVKYHFLSVAKAATAVVCTRCSPINKAKVVKLVSEKSFLFGDGAVTLAIGDGANDVPMIRFAHVGVGISGREGMQAVLASDFSITQFSHLKKLLLVHGARCHKRIAKLVLYSFSKNVALSLSQFWFGFYNGFSGQMMFFDFLFTLFNSMFTAIPILMLSTIDREHSDATLMSKPALYKTTSSNSNFSATKFFGWLLLGIWQSMIVFYFPFIVMADSSAKSGDLWVLGTSSYSILVFSLSVQVCLITSYWTLVNIGGVVGSVLFYIIFICVYCQVFTNGIGVLGGMFGNIDFWMMLLVVPLLAVCPYVLHRVLVYFFSQQEETEQEKEAGLDSDSLAMEPYEL